ncbi:MAG: Haloacid dehalogenase superfamily enzyme subfamily [Polaromonas sp.]|jgi:phosphoglycolate phosphatase|nr:Haloacid dehalogenase superfamily enzyme subfamily [Polaromonas sp.]
MSTKNFDLIAFDWDGTLFDSTQIIVRCIQAAVGDMGGTVPSDKEAAYVIGLGLMQALAHAAPDVPPEKYAALGDRYRHHYAAHYDDLSLFDGVLDMLADLKARGHLLAVATGKSRRGLDQTLESSELRGMFAASRTADETAGKPDPRMLHELMDELDVPAHRVLMIGDTTHDLQMAVNARCASVGVGYGAHEHVTFEGLHALHVAHSVKELHHWLTHNA